MLIGPRVMYIHILSRPVVGMYSAGCRNVQRQWSECTATVVGMYSTGGRMYSAGGRNYSTGGRNVQSECTSPLVGMYCTGGRMYSASGRNVKRRFLDLCRVILSLACLYSTRCQ